MVCFCCASLSVSGRVRGSLDSLHSSWERRAGRRGHVLTCHLWDSDLRTGAAVAPVAEGLDLHDVVLIQWQSKLHRRPVRLYDGRAAVSAPPVQDLPTRGGGGQASPAVLTEPRRSTLPCSPLGPGAVCGCGGCRATHTHQEGAGVEGLAVATFPFPQVWGGHREGLGPEAATCCEASPPPGGPGSTLGKASPSLRVSGAH